MDRANHPAERDRVWPWCLGCTDKEIAEALFLSPRTVNHHVAGLLAKFGASNRAAAVAAARADGLLPPDAPVGS